MNEPSPPVDRSTPRSSAIVRLRILQGLSTVVFLVAMAVYFLTDVGVVAPFLAMGLSVAADILLQLKVLKHEAAAEPGPA